MVKLLFDQNLSHRLVTILASVFPDSSHVRHFGLQSAADQVIWELRYSGKHDDTGEPHHFSLDFRGGGE